VNLGDELGPDSEPSHPTVPFIPSAFELELLHALESVPAPALEGTAATGTLTAVRATCATMGRGLRRFEILAARALRRAETTARVCRVTSRQLGWSHPDPELVGFVQHAGELWLIRLLDGLPAAARLDAAADIVSRYRVAAGTHLAEKWNLAPDVVHSCRDTGNRAVATRLARSADVLTPAVEAARDGRMPSLDSSILGPLGIDIKAARAIVDEASRA
jgi:hypothetical protein